MYNFFVGDNMCRWTTICAVRVGTYCRRRQYVQNDNMYRHMPLLRTNSARLKTFLFLQRVKSVHQHYIWSRHLTHFENYKNKVKLMALCIHIIDGIFKFNNTFWYLTVIDLSLLEQENWKKTINLKKIYNRRIKKCCKSFVVARIYMFIIEITLKVLC